MTGAGVTAGAFAAPSLGDGMSGKAGRVAGDADKDCAAVGEQIASAIRDRDPDGIGAEVVVIHPERPAVPLDAGVSEIAGQFPLLGAGAETAGRDPGWNRWPVVCD